MVAPFGHPEGVDPQRFHLIGPWNADPTAWLGMTFFDLYSGEEYGITVEDDFGTSGRVLVRSYEDVLSAYIRHIEAKSLDPMGSLGIAPGLLTRRQIRDASPVYIGKESNLIEEVEAGLWHKVGDVLAEYGQAGDPWASFVTPVLREMSARRLADATGLSPRQIQRVRNDHMRPHSVNGAALLKEAGAWARSQIHSQGLSGPRDDLLACRAWCEATGDIPRTNLEQGSA